MVMTIIMNVMITAAIMIILSIMVMTTMIITNIIITVKNHELPRR